MKKKKLTEWVRFRFNVSKTELNLIKTSNKNFNFHCFFLFFFLFDPKPKKYEPNEFDLVIVSPKPNQTDLHKIWSKRRHFGQSHKNFNWIFHVPPPLLLLCLPFEYKSGCQGVYISFTLLHASPHANCQKHPIES